MIDEYLEANQEDGCRKHLGGSMIGRECNRELWYSFRWAITPKHDGRLLRLFDRGHKEEFRFVEWLRNIGVTVWEYDENGVQWRIIDHKGHFGGSLDGIAWGIPDAPNEYVLLEFKTFNQKTFNQLLAQGVQLAKPEHYGQMQIYMHKMNLKKALYMAICKNDDSLYTEIIEYDQATAEKLLAKAGNIIFSDEAPVRVSNDPSFFKCKFCNYSNICHQKQVPEINCRTCAHSTPVDNGAWSCAKNILVENDNVSERDGCDQHVFNPYLFNPKVIEFQGGCPDENYIELLNLETGEVVQNGPTKIPSHELKL
jgi:hypothetical protein